MKRRRSRTGACIAVTGWLLCSVVGCEDGARGDAASGDGGASAGVGESLCTADRDPLDAICSQPDLLSLTAAFERASTEAPADAGLVRVMSDPTGMLSVDGDALSWGLTFERAAAPELTVVGVGGQYVMPTSYFLREGQAPCDVFIAPLDSERTVRDAVRRYEAEYGLFQHGMQTLFLQQESCGSERPESHVVEISSSVEDVHETFFYRYRDDGSFIEPVGPCMGSDLEVCLTGRSL